MPLQDKIIFPHYIQQAMEYRKVNKMPISPSDHPLCFYPLFLQHTAPKVSFFAVLHAIASVLSTFINTTNTRVFFFQPGRAIVGIIADYLYSVHFMEQKFVSF